MYIFSTPAWISKYKHEYGSVDEVPVQVFEDINKNWMQKPHQHQK